MLPGGLSNRKILPCPMNPFVRENATPTSWDDVQWDQGADNPTAIRLIPSMGVR